MYSACPKCGHAPLPENQAAPAACPACGLILAKYRAAAAPKDFDMAPPFAVPAGTRGRAAGGAGGAATAGTAGSDDSLKDRIDAWMFYVPDQVSRLNWQGRIAALAMFALWSIWIFRDFAIAEGHPGSHFLHRVLTPFHEAGHYAIFRWFGEFIMILGGTLGQHLMPLVLCGALLIKRRDPFGAALFFWLLGFSVADMGIYMYDAFDPKLLLLGGGTGAESDGHDWQNIFGDLHLLRRAQGIGRASAWIGALMMLAGLAWAASMVWLQRTRLSDAAFAEINPHE